MALVVHKSLKPLLDRIPNNVVVRFVSWALTFAFVVVTMSLFRVNEVGDLWLMLRNVATNFHLDYLPVFVDVRMAWCIFMAVLLISHFMPDEFWNRVGRLFVRTPWLLKLAIFVVVVQLVLQFRSEDVPPFIYFQF